MTISALVIVKNEQGNVERCLESLQWADEIVIVDSFSDDSTVDLCRKYTEKVYQRQFDDYSTQKNFGQSKCSSEWILSIDADERVTDQLADEIRRAVQNRQISAYRIPIRDWMFGKWIEHGGWDRQRHIRLYKQDRAVWCNRVHESIDVADGMVGYLTAPITHYSHTSISKFVEKMNRYTTLEAQTLYDQGIRIGWPRILRTLPWHFFQRYVLWQGFRDGAHGFILAVLIAMYHFLTRVKLWELRTRANSRGE